MEALRENAERTLRLQLDDQAAVSEVPGSKYGLSPFLSGSLDLYEAHALGENFLLAASRADGPSGADVVKQAYAVEEGSGLTVVLLLKDAGAARRRSLVSQRRGFLTEAGDLYLPHLALYLNSPQNAGRLVKGGFGPAEQALFLYCLYCGHDVVTQAEARDGLDMSAAGVSRAFGQLVDRKLLDYEVGGETGRLRSYKVVDRREFFRDGMRAFGSPVKRRVMVSLSSCDRRLPFSGLSALSALSDLTRPARDVYAAGRSEARDVEASEEVAFGAEPNCELQVLRYDPRPLARLALGDDACVDPVTMMLTVDEDDERISIAVRDVMGRFPWYTE